MFDSCIPKPITTKTGDVVSRGQGNHVSVEFNLLYRVRSKFRLKLAASCVLTLLLQWHATTAQEDIEWTERAFNNIFKLQATGKTFSTLTVNDVKATAGTLFKTQNADPSKRVFGGYVNIRKEIHRS